ncbi:MAG: hypothetical protein A2275_07130 [Bacteroidetes bacterium RIFOXYA12_FULL_35_11]|nr:MAG: hypothetical protein A2X01_04515 [Bacteroidetes bacterium GWF2_35_48]OFY83196.1 MAG: hypothetical protein A2275_07130 [Bacteroidetes bacterium RIFOXYA12_FULL_35_11]OFY96220.1 MAG: hypothetical protein A2491_16125 [Bacteroidetes bacterium RIFOXYC12_FULL_35_7]OFY97048.1 MAG: hypothetical protein A2309_00620 [Bacteroidetes bacterium RIFOXYB2_FULL_35_7]HBX53275.1 hypothetical protein [Bacteroidales bacterium]
MEKESQSVLIPDLAPASKGFEHIDTLLHCICNEIPVSFAHYSYNEQRFCAHIVHPYLLKEHRNRWYVFGYSELHKEVRQFGLDRLNDIILVERKFYRQQGIDTAKLYNHAIGVFLSDEKKLTTVELIIDPLYANFVKTQPLHPSQEIVKYGERGSVTIRIKVYPSRELVSLILSFGSGVIIKSPGWLRSDIMKELKIAFEINKHLESEMKQFYGK